MIASYPQAKTRGEGRRGQVMTEPTCYNVDNSGVHLSSTDTFTTDT